MEEIFGILITLLIIFGFMGALGTTEYDNFMKDCEELNEDKFYTGETYQDLFNVTKLKVNEKELKKFCQDKYTSNIEVE